MELPVGHDFDEFDKKYVMKIGTQAKQQLIETTCDLLSLSPRSTTLVGFLSLI
ncbi:MAG: hypothetical protein R2688_03045 [Fimbriimonadaceae bacterium]